MKKVHHDARAALAGLLRDDMTIVAGGFGLCGIPENLIDAHRRERRQGPDRGLQQLRRRRLGPRQAARPRQIKKMIQLLRRREQGVRAPVPGRRGRGRVQPARHAGRAHPRRRRRHPGLLHQDRRRHAGGRGQGDRDFDGETYVMERGHRRRSRDRQGLEGRPRGQSRLSQDRAQLQPDGGDRRQGLRGRGRAAGASPGDSTPTMSTRPASIVDRIIQGRNYEKRIEQRTVRKRAA